MSDGASLRLLFGPHRGQGGNYTTTVRSFLTDCAAFFGWDKSGLARDKRLVYVALWHCSTFSTTGVFSVPIDEIASFVGATDRRVRRALNAMDKDDRVIVYDPIRGLVFVPDIPVHNIHADPGSEKCKTFAQNMQRHIVQLGKSVAVDAYNAFMAGGTLPGGSVVSSQESGVLTVSQREVSRETSESIDTSGWDDLDFPTPPGKDRLTVINALEGNDVGLQATTIADILITVQEQYTEPDDRNTVIKFAKRRLLASPDTRAVVMRIIARRDEGHALGDYSWLGANAVFGMDTNIADHTDGLVWKQFDEGERPSAWRKA